MKLQPVTDDDFQEVMSWIPDSPACQRWAGPLVRFPMTLESLKAQIAYLPQNTYALKNEQGKLLGFGQILEKPDGRIHMARIVVAPGKRRRGVGERLCRLLMEAARRRYGRCCFSLNVYAANQTAVKLYQKLGFRQQGPPSGAAAETDVLYMLKAEERPEASYDP